MSDPFEYVNSILQSKKQMIVDNETEKNYNPFITNRALSYHKDCIFYANEMNKNHFLDKKLQFDFLINTIRSQKRPFAKWVKKEKGEDLECIKRVYNISNSKAREVYPLLSKEQIKHLKEMINTGGIQK